MHRHMDMDARGRGLLRAGRPWRGIARALLASLHVVLATGLRSPRCGRLRA